MNCKKKMCANKRCAAATAAARSVRIGVSHICAKYRKGKLVQNVIMVRDYVLCTIEEWVSESNAINMYLKCGDRCVQNVNDMQHALTYYRHKRYIRTAYTSRLNFYTIYIYRKRNNWCH